MQMRILIKKIVNSAISGISKTSAGLFAYQAVVDAAMKQEKKVIYKSCEMSFTVPNRLTHYRADTFSTKEPETLDWIDSISLGALLWDIGANVGIYSVYAAKARGCKVIAFEPSVFNLELLARNIYINKLQEQITIVPIALSDNLGTNTFRMSTTSWGGALSTFGEDFDQDGEKFRDVFEYKTLGLSMEQAVLILKIPLPEHIKIDVDGIEHFILRGGEFVLKQVKSVLIEINDSFIAQAQETEKYLTDAGLTLFKKCDCGSHNQFNQLWIRKNN